MQARLRFIRIILASGQPQTSSSNFVCFVQVCLMEIGIIKLPDEEDSPPDVDTPFPGQGGSNKLKTEGDKSLTDTTTNTSSRVEMGK